MSSPLNPALYSRLQEEFGTVQLAHEGSSMISTHTKDPLCNSKMRLSVVSAGEYYRVNCPYCGDLRGRLWINHKWGVLDTLTGNKNLWLAVCYNENCLEANDRPRQLYDRIYGFKNANLRGKNLIMLPGNEDETKLVEATLPGRILKLSELNANSYAIKYLIDKGFDPQYLETNYGVSYCYEAYQQYKPAYDRLVIPIYMRGSLVGWQCRFIGEVDWKQEGIPKYYTMPRMPKRAILYNYDKAILNPYVIICEGPSDVWIAGNSSVAVMGKTLSAQQLQLICSGWQNGAVLVMLDGDAQDSAIKMLNTLQNAFVGKVGIIDLPIDKDPGKYNQEALKALIHNKAKEQGIDLDKVERTNIGDYTDCQPIDCGAFA